MSQTPGPNDPQDPYAAQGQPAYPSAPGAYPSAPEQGYPAAPGGAPGASGPAPTSPPPPLALAVKLMWAGAALSLISILLSFTQTDAIREQVEDAAATAGTDVDALVTFTLVIGVVTGLIGVGLWILNAVFNAKGKKWARILSTVLGGLAILFFLFSLTQPTTGLSLVIGVLQVLLAAVILWFIWRPESSRYYEAMSSPRY